MFHLHFPVNAGMPPLTREDVFETRFNLNAIDQATGAPIADNAKTKSAYARLLDVAAPPKAVNRSRPTVTKPRTTSNRATPTPNRTPPRRKQSSATGSGVFR